MNTSITFLVADDDADDLELFREAATDVLGDQYVMVEVSDGSEVISYLLELTKSASNTVQKPDVIVLDLNMPKLNGFKTLEMIKTNPLISHFPVYVLTTSWEESSMRQCRQLGAAGFFTKPAKQQILKNIIRQIATEISPSL